MSGASLLVRRADVVVTMDDAADDAADDGQREIAGGSVYVRDGVVEQVGDEAEVAAWIAADPASRTPAKVIDARGCVVLPGLVNGHHHLFQSLTRAIGTAGGLVLFDWLKRLYPVWAALDPEAIRVSAELALADLMLSGATTVADHLYLFPNGARLDDEIDAARALGVRFNPTRGSMSIGQGLGGLPPDDLVEDEDAILADSLRVVETFHDASFGSMLRIGLAPCSPFTASADLMRETARRIEAHAERGWHAHIRASACIRIWPRRSTRIASAPRATAWRRSTTPSRSTGSAPTCGSRTWSIRRPATSASWVGTNVAHAIVRRAT